MSPAEDLPDEVRDRAYHAQPVWKRIVVIAAGPAVNLVLAFVLLFAYLALSARAIRSGRPRPSTRSSGVPRRGEPRARRPRRLGRRRERWPRRAVASRSRPTSARASHSEGCKAAEPVTVVVERDGKTNDARADADLRPGDRAQPARVLVRWTTGRATRSRGAAFTETVDRFWFVTKETAKLPAKLIDPEQRKQLSGVVGTYEITRQTILDDLADVLAILALISLSLAIVNLFPFLPLDGGHIFWAIVEGVRRKPVPYAVMERSGVIGFMLVIVLFVIGLSNDIDRLQGTAFKYGKRASADRGRRAPWKSRPHRSPATSPARSRRRRSPRPSSSRPRTAPTSRRSAPRATSFTMTWAEYAAAGREDRGRPGGAGPRPRRHRRDHAHEPARVPSRRRGGDAPRRDAVLDLQHLHARPDRVPGLRRRDEDRS